MVEQWERNVLPTLSEYVRIPCLSPAFDDDWAARGALKEAAGLLARWCTDQAVPGLDVEVLELPGRTPLLLAEAPAKGPGAADRPPVLLYGHLDKQPPQGTWRQGLGPYEPVRLDDRLYGRGTADDGYATFAALSALRALVADDVPRPRTLLLVEASEESASPDLEAYVAHLAPRLGRPGLVVCLDSGALTYDRLWRTSSLRGMVMATVTVRVLEEGLHSGLAGGVVPSSFRILRRLLDRVEDPDTGDLRLAEFQAQVPEAHRREAAAVAADFPTALSAELPVLDGVRLDGDGETDRLLRRSWGPSLATVAAGGLPSLGAGGNVLRPFTSLRLAVRVPPSVDPDRAAGALVGALTHDPPSGAEVTVSDVDAAPGWVAPEPPDWAAAAFERASRRCFDVAPASYGEGGTIPFLAMLGQRFPGVPLIATGVLGPQSNAHGPNEFLHLPMAQAVTVAVAELLAAAAT